MSRRTRLAGLLAAGTAVAGFGAQPAAAETRVIPLSFDGADCRAVSTATHRLPAAARLVHASEPVVGAWLDGTKGDAHPRADIARVTAVEVRGRTLSVTVAADPARCIGTAVPGEPVDSAWTVALDATVSLVVPDERWARTETTRLARSMLGPGYADEVRSRCRRAGQARFSCEFGTFAGDMVIGGRGQVSIGRDDERPRFAFTVRRLNEYCSAVRHRPLGRCLTTERWRS